MTAAPAFRVTPPTANDLFKNHYGRTMRTALAFGLLIHGAAFVLIPGLPVHPYRLTREPSPEVISIPDFRTVAPAPDVPLPPRPGPVPVPGPAPPIPVPVPPVPPFVPGAPGVSGSAVDSPPAFFPDAEKPVLTGFVAPVYPFLARDAGIEGTVRVRVRVDVHGRAVEAAVVDSDVTPAMDAAALRAALKCRFQPARQQSVPVEAYVVVPFSFSLR